MTRPHAAEARPFRSFLVAVALALAALLLVAGLRSHGELQEARERGRRLRTELEEKRQRIAELEHRNRLLVTSPAALERLAREELGMMRPGEIVVVLASEDAAPAAVSPAPAPPARP